MIAFKLAASTTVLAFGPLVMVGLSEIQPEPGKFYAIAGILGIVALMVLKRQFDHIMTAIERIESFDTERLKQHYSKVHDLSNEVGANKLRLDLHEKRLDNLENGTPPWGGTERRARAR